MGRKRLWGEVENKFIIENAAHMKDSEMAAVLSGLVNRRITIQGIRKQRQKLDVLKASGRGKCQLRPTQSIQVSAAVSQAAAREVSGNSDVGGSFMFTPNGGESS